MRCDPGKVHVVYTGCQIERQVLTSHKKVLVVDGERGAFSVFGRCGFGPRQRAQAQHDDQEFLHFRVPSVLLAVGEVFSGLSERTLGGRKLARAPLTTGGTGNTGGNC
jgi:hypothetical protein